MELIDLLTKNLGINETQATGGAGLLFKQAQTILGNTDFAKISAAVPEIQGMINAAPSGESTATSGIGNFLSGLSGNASKIGSLANLVGGFSKLGLKDEMIGKFIPLILSFVESKGGTTIKSLLEKAIK